MLIATLPAAYQTKIIRSIVSHPLIDAVRYNTGNTIPDSMSPRQALETVAVITNEFGKKLYVDLEGRQLRVAHWSQPKFGGRILLNREVEIDYPAKINFRHDPNWYPIKLVNGKAIYLEVNPEKAIGDGQTVNISGNWKVKGNYLTEIDIAYAKAAIDLGISSFMLSFIESEEDIKEFEELFGQIFEFDWQYNNLEVCLKIENAKGLEFVQRAPIILFDHYSLVVARDDFWTNLGENKTLICQAMAKIIEKDKKAILASKIFSSIEREGQINIGDISDIWLAKKLGYNNFMLSDNLCSYYFDAAMEAWRQVATL